jgi:hypothetical protein
LVGSKTTARKELVLVHPDQTVKPGTTREWLKVHRHSTTPDRRIVSGSINTTTSK